LPDKKVPDYQNMASFRNMLVHHYEKVDDEIVFGIFKNKLGDFDIFRKYIFEYLNRSNVLVQPQSHKDTNTLK